MKRSFVDSWLFSQLMKPVKLVVYFLLKWSGKAALLLALLLSGCTTYRIYIVQIHDSQSVNIIVKTDVDKPLEVTTDATVPIGPLP